ncbi:MAG TPA: SPOR domain-containing protein [Bryobacteraceae bacterium]|nr:SPOR domain-containing protein [Bryobacteraceae bacterium]
MSSAAQLPEIAPFDGAPVAERKTRGVYVGFATLVTVGLALAGWYVGERILVAQAPHVPTEAFASASIDPVPAAALPSIAAPQIRPLAEDSQPLLPLTEYYLQTMALGTAQDLKFLKQLQSRGFKAHLETTPADQTGLILIGPYVDQPAVRRARATLADSGILATETIR